MNVRTKVPTAYEFINGYSQACISYTFFSPVPPASGVRIHLPFLTVVLATIVALVLAKVIA